MARRLSTKAKLKSLVAVTVGGVSIFSGFNLYQGNEKFYDGIVMPLVRLIDPETAHNLAVKSISWGFYPAKKTVDPPCLGTNIFGLNFNNPLGMAAGFDKQAEAVNGLNNMGFGFVEIGSVTPQPQEGNPKPRVFRLIPDRAVINRYGFNSDGHEKVYQRLVDIKTNPNFMGIVGVNLGKNKTSTDPIKDYTDGIKKFNDVADYFVINISSPNTVGLRNLQSKKNLEELLCGVNDVRNSMDKKTPLLLKLAPDLDDSEKQDIAYVIQQKKSKVDGLILSNTTISRNNLIDDKRKK